MKEGHLEVFFSSLSRQTFDNFDVVVLNDNYGPLNKFKSKYSELNIIDLPYNGTIAKNREYVINFVKNSSYDIAIFGDSDDYFDANRIEKAVELLGENDIVVNDITLFDDGGIYDESYISKRVKNNSLIDIEFIKDKNIFGMSNTAVRLSIFGELNFNPDLIAVDWFLFSILLLNSATKAVFTTDTQTYYRQYADNTVGMKMLTKSSYIHGLVVKEKHYRALSSYNDCFIHLGDEVQKLARVAVSEELVEELNIVNSHPLWWENIRRI
jgi:Glycosyl transferase family 2.